MRAVIALASLAVAGVLPSCGDTSDGGASEAKVEAWGLTGVETASVDLAACDTVIVFAVDKVMRTEWIDGGSPDATRRIDSIRAGAMEVTDAIAASTAGNGALASLLTGRHVSEHGIVSLRDTARQRLPDAESTLAEGFQEAGWTTIFSSGSPLHARGLSGFSQGFDHYEAPRLAEYSRLASATGNGALLPLKRALQANESVFALVCFDDLTARSLRVPSAEVAAPFVRARLAPLAVDRADIEAGLRTLDVDPAKGLADLALLLARARGSRASTAWNMALRDAYLSLIDGAIGEILDALEAAGRGERALIVVTGLRGTLPPGYRHESGALFTSDAIRLPMAIRWPGGARRGEAVEETASLLDLPRALDAAFALGLGETQFRAADLSLTPGPAIAGAALVVDSQRKLFAAVDGDLQLERYSDGASITFDRSGGVARGADEHRVARLTGELQGFVADASAIGLTFALRDSDSESEFAPELDLEVAWETGDGAALEDGGNESSVRGKFKLSGAEGGRRAAEFALTERATALRIRLRTPGPSILDAPTTEHIVMGPAAVRLGSVSSSTPLADLPVLYAPLDDVAPRTLAEGTPPARLRFERADGLAWTLFVDPPPGSSNLPEGGGAAVTEVLLSIWPPRYPSVALEVQAGGGTRSEPVPGRLDMVRISGVAPLICRVKKLAKEDFVVACRTSDGFLAPTEMEYHGLRFADRHAFEFVVPHWQPAASAGLPSLDPALFGLLAPGSSASATGPSLVLQRFEFGPPATWFSPPPASDVEELVRLAPGE